MLLSHRKRRKKATAHLLRILRMRPLLLFQRSLVLGPVALFPCYHVADLDSVKGRKNSRIIREKKKKLLYGEVLFKIDSLFWFALETLLMGFLWLILGKSQESLRNELFITHTLSYCSALKIFCFATSSFAFAIAAAVAIYKFLLSGRFGIWQEQAKKDSERNFEILKIRKLLIDLHSILFNSVQFIIQRLWMTALEKPLEVRSKRF